MFYISRFKDVEKREYDCEVVTPLFLGGADTKEAELRVPPIKAAMRFWWRALYEGGNVDLMAKEEAEIFGSTAKKSVVNVKLDHLNIQPVLKDLPPGKKIMEKSKGKTFPISIVEYLAYGLFDPRQKTGSRYIRKHIEPNNHFKLTVTFPTNVQSGLIQAMKAMVTFGGFGSRSRNGFGSLHCVDLFDQTFKKQGNLKPFTSFSSEAKLFEKFNKYERWEEALSEIGDVYRNARLKLEKRHTWEKRRFIAMPIEARNEIIPALIKNGRHAKPYFLHVNKTPDGKYQGQVLFLPYLYKTGPNEKSDRVHEYREVCMEMNEEMAKKMEGAK